MQITLDKKMDTRLSAWSMATKRPPEQFINETLDKALEDWEDYEEALRICELVDKGLMKVYSFSEVERQLDELNTRVFLNYDEK